MPLEIKGKVYAAPNEGDQPGITGREIIEIEDHFGLDGLTLIRVLAEEGLPRQKGYTRAKALFALAWVCMVRGGEVVSLDDVLNDLSLGDIAIVDDESDNVGKGEEASSSEAATETE